MGAEGRGWLANQGTLANWLRFVFCGPGFLDWGLASFCREAIRDEGRGWQAESGNNERGDWLRFVIRPGSLDWELASFCHSASIRFGEGVQFTRKTLVRCIAPPSCGGNAEKGRGRVCQARSWSFSWSFRRRLPVFLEHLLIFETRLACACVAAIVGAGGRGIARDSARPRRGATGHEKGEAWTRDRLDQESGAGRLSDCIIERWWGELLVFLGRGRIDQQELASGDGGRCPPYGT